jgi:hypothetical protein
MQLPVRRGHADTSQLHGGTRTVADDGFNDQRDPRTGQVISTDAGCQWIDMKGWNRSAETQQPLKTGAVIEVCRKEQRSG